MKLKSEFIDTNGIRLHAITAGSLTGPLVILLHGFPEFWYGWKKQISPLAKVGFRVVAPDQRGYNLSDKPPAVSDYCLDHLAADVVGLIDAFGREQATIVGHDWGAIVAWAVAAMQPQRVAKLAILNGPYPWAGIRAVRRDPSQLLRSQYISFFQLPGLPEALLRNDNWALLITSLQRMSRPGAFNEIDFEEYRSAWWRRGAMPAMLNWYRAMVRRPAKLPWKPHIQPPTLILWGKDDMALSPATADLSLEMCDHGRLEFLQAGHFVQHELPDVVTQRLIEFLS